MFVHYKGPLVPLWKEKETNMYIGGLLMNFELIMNFIKKTPSLLSLITTVVFNNLIEVENYIYWTCD